MSAVNDVPSLARPSAAPRRSFHEWSPSTSANLTLDLIAFVERCRTVRDFDAVQSSFHSLILPFGFEHATLIDMMSADADPAEGIVFSTFLPEWIGAYVHGRWERTDPVWLAAVSGTASVIWSRLAADARAHGQGAPLFFESIGLADGMTIPINSPRAPRAAMFLGAKRVLALDAVSQAALTLASSVFAVRAFQRGSAKTSQRRLSEREREILTLTALGRSAREISQVLDLSQKTVVHHLTNVRLKLRATNTVQAVGIAMREKLIAL